MTDCEKLKRDTDTLNRSIRVDWVELESEPLACRHHRQAPSTPGWDGAGRERTRP
jgi:hypothetical protein